MLARKIAWTIAFAIGYAGGIIAILNVTESPWIVVFVVIAFGGAAITVWVETPRMAVPRGMTLPVGVAAVCLLLTVLGVLALAGAAPADMWVLLLVAFGVPWFVYPVVGMRERFRRNREERERLLR